MIQLHLNVTGFVVFSWHFPHPHHLTSKLLISLTVLMVMMAIQMAHPSGTQRTTQNQLC